MFDVYKFIIMGYGFYVTGRTTSILRGVVTLLMGCCLLFWPGFTAGLIVKLIAGFLLTIGFITLFTALMAASKTNSPMPVIVVLNVAVYLIFGLLVFLFPNFFLGLIAFLFGGVLLIGGISQIIGLYQGSRYAPLSGGMYVIPVAITVCGIALFFSPRASTEMLTMIFGAAVALYGISELVAAWKLRKPYKQEEYTDFEEVK